MGSGLEMSVSYISRLDPFALNFFLRRYSYFFVRCAWASQALYQVPLRLNRQLEAPSDPRSWSISHCAECGSSAERAVGQNASKVRMSKAFCIEMIGVERHGLTNMYILSRIDKTRVVLQTLRHIAPGLFQGGLPRPAIRNFEKLLIERARQGIVTERASRPRCTQEAVETLRIKFH
jgi:hypothetical protein